VPPDNKGVIVEIDNLNPGPPAAALLKRAKEAGELVDINWLDGKRYKYPSTVPAVKAAQAILSNWTNRQILDVWLRVETICEDWRALNNMTIVEGQKGLPMQFIPTKTDLHLYRLSRDAECFTYMTVRREKAALAFFEEIDFRDFLAVMILYENHFGFTEDAHGSFSQLQEHEKQEMEPDAARGRKVIDGASEGHEIQFGTEKGRIAKSQLMQEYVDELFLKNPSLSYSDMKRKAASKFDVSTKTVQRNTQNPKKNKVRTEGPMS